MVIEYRFRLIEAEISRMLTSFKAICIEGPKDCGKTTVARRFSSSEFSFDDLHNVQQTDLLEALTGIEPHLVDEWQSCPMTWDAGKYLVDECSRKGRLIFTGSSTPPVKGVHHDGAGRYGMVRMRPLSLFESGDSKGTVSLRGLFDGRFETAQGTDESLTNLIDFLVRGGWPASMGMETDVAMKYCREYVKSAIVVASVLDGKSRNSASMEALVKVLALNEGKVASIPKIITEISETGISEDVTPSEIYDCIDALERIFFSEDLQSFSYYGRTKLHSINDEKRYLADPSLSIAALGIGTNQLLEDVKTFDSMFNALCIRDLRVYAQANDWGSVYHYRDDRGVEVDAIVQLNGGRYAAFEIKVGDHQADEGAKSLCRFRDRMDESGVRLPQLLCVLTGTGGAAYRRDDGVYVVPITQLKH